jgi:hypothetical protein
MHRLFIALRHTTIPLMGKKIPKPLYSVFIDFDLIFFLFIALRVFDKKTAPA